MPLLSYIPVPPLSKYIEMFWYAEGYVAAHGAERILPAGTSQLVINLKKDRLSLHGGPAGRRERDLGGSVFCGAQSDFFAIDADQQTSVLGIQFKPAGAVPFLPCPPGAVYGKHLDLADLWPATARILRERLLEAPTPAAKFMVMQETVLAEMSDRAIAHPAVAFAVSEFTCLRDGQTVADVAERVGLSHRRFIQLFNDQVGLRPKLFCRVRRFQQGLRLLDQSKTIDWAQTALSCGYYDQAHFINDFREFSGMYPTEYVANGSAHVNHVRHI